MVSDMAGCNYILTDAEAFRFFAESDAAFGLEPVPSPNIMIPPAGNLFMFCRNRVTKALIGLGDDRNTHYEVTWELTGDEGIFGKSYMILQGWGDPPFEGYRIGISHVEMEKVLVNLRRMHPNLFNGENYRLTDGLEDYSSVFYL